MSVTYSSPGVPHPGRSLFIATPAYECVKPGYAYSLALTTAELVRHHVPFEIGIMEGNCHVDDGRNTLVRNFLASNCTDMIFIDADVMWQARDVIKMVNHNEPLICGAYPKKCSPAVYPIGRILHARQDGMLEVSYAPTGFMRIRREVFDKLYKKQSRHGRQKPTAVFFERRFNGNTRDGGDVTFCRKWIAEGGKVVVDPLLTLSHVGEMRWTGRFFDYLAKDENKAKHIGDAADPPGAGEGKVGPGPGMDTPLVFNSAIGPETVPYWVNRLRNGDVADEVFQGLADAYGNKPWAATWDFHKLLWQMATNLPEDATILECGCGLSTVVIAATGRKSVSLEEHRDWAEKTQSVLDECGLDAEILIAPMKDGWFNVRGHIAGLGASLVVIDGPKRREGIRRDWPITEASFAIGAVRRDAAVLWDDVIAVSENSGRWVRMGEDGHPFCAGRLGAAMVPGLVPGMAAE